MQREPLYGETERNANQRFFGRQGAERVAYWTMQHIGRYPTPLQRIELPSEPGRFESDRPIVWVKRDDLSSERYGGNKVRKLERVLDRARRLGKRRVLTFGAAGSHHVLATGVYAPDFGLKCAAIVVPQPRTDHSSRMLRLSWRTGAELHPCRGYWDIPRVLARTFRPRSDYLLAPGASTPLGSLGYMEAVDELAHQLDLENVPPPEAMVVALGSGGTMAGLLAGVARRGWKTLVVGIRVVPWPMMTKAMVVTLAMRTAFLADVQRGSHTKSARLTHMARHARIDDRFLGMGYGYPTATGIEATEVARSLGLQLDPSYTAKAFAACLDYARVGKFRRMIYWHTLGAVRGELRAMQDQPVPSRLVNLLQ